MLPSFRVLFLFFALLLVSGQASSNPPLPVQLFLLLLPSSSLASLADSFATMIASTPKSSSSIGSAKNMRPALLCKRLKIIAARTPIKKYSDSWMPTDDGSLVSEEKQNARIIIFGHSWGASETVELARQLGKEGIPVLLTIQVDSVSKLGENDAVIPANVAQAVNFYQLDGMLHGQPKIRAADPAHTRILGNFRSDYKSKPLHVRPISLVGPRLHEATHSNRMRSRCVEASRIAHSFELVFGSANSLGK